MSDNNAQKKKNISKYPTMEFFLQPTMRKWEESKSMWLAAEKQAKVYV